MKTASVPAILFRFWENTQSGSTAASEEEWHQAIQLVEQHGKGMEETLRFLYMQRPAFNDFMQWLQPVIAEQVAERLEENVLTANDLSFFRENGYIVIKNAVTPQQAKDAAQAIWEHLGASPDDASGWYRRHEDLRGLMLTFYHHPALVANRKSPRVRRAYEQLYGTTEIHGNIDKVSFNPPESDSYRFMGSPLHWDVSLQLPIPFRLQGLLYLTDTDAVSGAFHCVPGFHNRIGEWIDSLPEGADPRTEALSSLQPVPVTGNAGDFIIWHQALPHCATPNYGKTPRLVQYFTYLLPDVYAQKVWK